MVIEFIESAKLPTRWGLFDIHGFWDDKTNKEHIALTMGDFSDASKDAVLTRVHSECLTGDGLFSLRCDCGPQLEGAMKKIAQDGFGIILYLR
ncbi:MAG: GTP cyclohydrolase II, partial [Pseudomonadota bacterium]